MTATTTPTVPITASTTAAADPAAARTGNEATWRASALALYAGDLEEFLRHWVDVPRYRVAYPVEGMPATIEGRDQFLAVFGAFGAAADRIEVHDVRFHQTTDPDVAFVEERMVADLKDGSRYENQMVIRVTFDGGLISELFEYYGEVAHRDLIGRLAGRS
jgi:ketosteroid isomerase-like protein